MDTQRIVLFVIFSFSIMMLWDAWQKEQHPQPAPQAITSPAATPLPKPGDHLTPKPVAAPQAAAEVLTSGEQIRVQTDVFSAEINLVGGDIRRLELRKYQNMEDKTKPLVLFESGQQRTYVAQSGLIGSGLPTHRTLFSGQPGHVSLAESADKLQVRLSWSGNGVGVDKLFTFHKGSYVVTVGYEITNHGATEISPLAYFQWLRDGNEPTGAPMFVTTYTGPAVYTEKEKFQKVAFSDIDKGKEQFQKQSNDGWVALLQHYFFSAWLPEKGQSREFYTQKAGNLYTAGVILPVGSIAPGAKKSLSTSLYVGPQEQEKINQLAPGLDLVVDYGVLTIIATPLFWVLQMIHKAVQNWGVAIILLTVLIKLAFYPLSAKSYRSMAAMRTVSPKLQKLKEQYGDDRQRLHQAMMELYKTEKINPLGGCLPVIVQMPVFIALYWVLLYSVEMRQAPFAAWIQDLSAPDPFYVLPIIMGITMVVQTRLNPTPPDPIQAKVMAIMPVAFSIFFFFFPAGLVLYWLVNNIISIAQQWQINRVIARAHAAKGHG